MTRTRYCQIFHCDERGDRYCCRDCWLRQKCANPCLNDPSRCRLVDTDRTFSVEREEAQK